jgi:outer membrane protein
MNKFSFFLATFALVFSLSGFAQKSPKFGHINSAELLSLMPERKAAMAKMDSVTKEAEKLLQEMMTEYRTEQDKYTAESGKMSELAKKTAEEKLTGLGTRIQNFQQQAQESLQAEETKLIEPIVTKAKKAIEQVAKENGYTYVVDTSTGAFLYWEESDNLLALVKKKLGLQ